MADNTSVYECMFILDSNKYAKDAAKAGGQVGQLIEKCGGEVLVSRLWVEQKLAYPIEGHRKGTYWLSYFRLDRGQVGMFNRECQLNENIVRHLMLKVEPRLVETLVAHASGNAVAGEGSSEKSEEKGEEKGKGKGKEESQASEKTEEEPAKA